ncbi:MAG: hypothetical protein ABIR24_08145 [Verrucomicrobiota bacterium]
MNEIEFDKLKETNWRRKLTAQEDAALNLYLAAHPAARSQWEEEFGLRQLLGNLSDAPVATNFTTRVLQAVERDAELRARHERGVFHWLKFNWLPRIAVASLLICGGVLSVQQYNRTQIAKGIVAISSAANVPQQWLQDFDAITRLSQPPVDNELLAALQ